MSQGLPCINPVCDYTFSLAEIRGAASLTCPRCGNVFQLGGGGSPARAAPAPRLATPAAESPTQAERPLPVPRPAREAAYAEASTQAFTPTDLLKEGPPPAATATVAFSSSPPVAQRVETSAEEFGITDSPTFSMTSPPVATPLATAFAPEMPISAATLARKRQPGLQLWKQLVLGFALGGLLIGFPVMAWLYGIFSFQRDDGGSEGDGGFKIYLLNKQGGEELTCRLGIDRDAWKQNQDFKELLKASIALEQEYLDPKTQKQVLIHLVVAGQDYGQQKPSDAELLKQAVSRLENCFGTDLVADTTPEETQIDGKRTLTFGFQGKVNSVEYLGRCYALTHHGVGYWVYVMQNMPEKVDQDLAEKFFEQLQSQKRMGFRIIDKRQGWTEQPPETDPYLSENGKMTIRVAKGRWESFNAKDADPQGEIYIRSKEKRKYQKKHEQEATLLVFTLEKKTPGLKEAVQAAAEYVDKQKKDLNETFEVKPIKPAGKEKMLPKKVGNQLGQIVEYEMVSEDKEYKKYIMLGVIHRPNHIYVIQCESFWQYRQSWRGDFVDMMSSFKLIGE